MLSDYEEKPFMVAETGSCPSDSGGDKGNWMAQMRNDMKSPAYKNVKAVVYFNVNKECNWRVDSSPSSLAAYKAMGADSYFNHGGTVLLGTIEAVLESF